MITVLAVGLLLLTGVMTVSVRSQEVNEDEEFNEGYWEGRFEITEIRLDSIDVPDFVEYGDEFEAVGKAHYAHLFPEVYNSSISEEDLEDYRFTIRESVEKEILVEVPSEEIDFSPGENYSTFEADIPTENIDERGDYVLQLEVLPEDESEYKTIEETLTVWKIPLSGLVITTVIIIVLLSVLLMTWKRN